MTRLEVATHLLAGICAGDWKFDVKNSTWDEVAAQRAVDLADKLIEADKQVVPIKKPKLKVVKDDKKA